MRVSARSVLSIRVSEGTRYWHCTNRWRAGTVYFSPAVSCGYHSYGSNVSVYAIIFLRKLAKNSQYFEKNPQVHIKENK